MYWIPEGKYNIGKWNMRSWLGKKKILFCQDLESLLRNAGGRFILPTWKRLFLNFKTVQSLKRWEYVPHLPWSLGQSGQLPEEIQCIFNQLRRNRLINFKWATWFCNVRSNEPKWTWIIRFSYLKCSKDREKTELLTILKNNYEERRS